jgi:hypothetical protein
LSPSYEYSHKVYVSHIHLNLTLTTSTSQVYTYLPNARLSHRDNHVYERKRNGCPLWSRRALQPTSWKSNVPKGDQRKQRALSKMRGFQPAQALVGRLDCQCHSPSRWSLCQKKMTRGSRLHTKRHAGRRPKRSGILPNHPMIGQARRRRRRRPPASPNQR